MEDKIIIITGANSGIGKEAAIEIAKAGAQVVMICREAIRGNAAKQEVVSKSGNSKVDLVIMQLDSLTSIREACTELIRKYPKIDVLINNAGRMNTAYEKTADGFELTFGVNHLAHFLLTDLLLENIKKAPKGRIINVSSHAHYRGKLDFENLQGEKYYQGWPAYNRSKLENVMFTYALARRLEGTKVTVNAMHPGVVASNFYNNFKGFWWRIAEWILKPFQYFMIDSKAGADTIVYLALSQEVANVTGKYFYKRKSLPSSTISYDVQAQEKLWEISNALANQNLDN